MRNPPDHKDTAQDIARDLADIAGQSSPLSKERAAQSLREPNYNTLKLRLEVAHSAVEAALLWRLGGGYG